MGFTKSSTKAPEQKPAQGSQQQQGAPPARVGNGGGQQPKPDAEQIARRAYERFVQRGGQHGRDQEDWIEAEKELQRRNR